VRENAGTSENVKQKNINYILSLCEHIFWRKDLLVLFYLWNNGIKAQTSLHSVYGSRHADQQ
jgi:hypothetical protein